MLLVQTGYPVDHVLRICVQSISGLKNRRRRAIIGQEADPEFYELLSLLRNLYEADGLAIRTLFVDNKMKVVLIFRPTRNETHAGHLRRVKQLLGLDSDLSEFPIVHGRLALDNKEIAFLNRTMMEIMADFASYIDVPVSDISQGRVEAVLKENPVENGRHPPQFRVHSSSAKPDNAFVAVPYRESWFWIDDRDFQSKMMFNFLSTLFSFTERGKSENVTPIITVPTN